MFRAKVTENDGILDEFLARARSGIADKLIPASHRNGRVLDIGCGVYPLFLVNTDFREKYAIDRVPRKSAECHFNGRAIRLINGDLEKLKSLPFEYGFFDVITMLAVFEHIEPEKLHDILREVHRVLKEGGLLIITTPAAWTNDLLNLMAKFRLVSRIGMKEHKDRYAPSKIARLLQESGFSKEKMRFGYFEMFMNIWTVAAK